MKKLFSFILLTVLLTSCGTKPPVINNEIEYEKVYVKDGEISLWGEYNGVVEALNSANLSAKIWGKVVLLNKEVWDNVTVWELVAKVDSDEAKISLTQAQDTLTYLESLYNSTENSFNSQIQAMEEWIKQINNNIKIAKTNLWGLETWIEDTENINTSRLEEAKKWIQTAEINLDNLKEKLENTESIYLQKEKDIYWSVKPNLNWAKILLEKWMIFIDEFYGLTEKNKNQNDSYEDNISSKNPSYKISLIKSFEELNPKINSWKEKVENYSFNENDFKKEETYALLKETETILWETRELFSSSFNALDNTNTSTYLPASVLSKVKDWNTEFQKEIEKTLINIEWGKVIWIKGLIQNVDNLYKQKQLDTDALNKGIEAATATFERANKSYETLTAANTWKINEITTKKEISETQIDLAKNELNSTLLKIESLKSQKESNLNQIQTQIRWLKANKSTASVMVNNANVYIPFSWIITQKFAEIGEVKWWGMPLYRISDDKELKIKVFIPESKIKEISKWDKVSVYIKGLDKNFEGEINKVSPIVDALSKRGEVEIKVNNENQEIKLWMYANITLKWETVSGLKVPYNSIKYMYGQPYVVKLNEEWKKEKINIEVQKCNTNFCIIKWNLKNTDQLINY